MIALRPIGSNQTELETSRIRILFSYHTPVAAYVLGRGYIKTKHFYSVTTSKHVNKWVGPDCETVDQSEVDALLVNVQN